MGAEAVLALMDATPETEACVVSLVGNSSVRLPLMECVKKTKAVTEAMANQNWDLAVELRGYSFMSNLEIYKMLSKNKPKNVGKMKGGRNMAVMNIGAPCCGVNAAVRSFVRNCIAGGHHCYAIFRGIEGLVAGNIKEMEWGDVNDWVSQGGSLLGTKRTLPQGHFKEIAEQLKKHRIEVCTFN